MELRPEDASLADAFRDAASRYLPVDLRDVAVDSGADAAVDALDRARWRQGAEYIRPRPKYYHLFEWMREQVEAACPGLPDPVMDKLLAMDADEGSPVEVPARDSRTGGGVRGVLRDPGREGFEDVHHPDDDVGGIQGAERRPRREPRGRGEGGGGYGSSRARRERRRRTHARGSRRASDADLARGRRRQARRPARKSSPKLAARLPPDQLRDARAAAVDARERGASSTTARRTRTFVATAMDDMD